MCVIAPVAHATVPPVLSVAATGTGDNVQLSVTGDPNSSVLLSYNETGVGPQITSLGTTDANGSFTTTISSSGYNIASGTIVHVLIGGTGGPSSPNVTWPAVTSSTALAFTPAALVLTVGQSGTITANNTGGNALYLSNNSNPSIANASISGANITVTGNVVGQTTLTLCSVGTSSSCPTVFVMVEQSGASQLTLSQTNVNIPSGQNVQVTVSGGSGMYQIQNNSNAAVIGATMSGSVLTLSTSANTGAASILICTTDTTICGVVTATAASASSVVTSFSNTSPSIAAGSSMAINIYGLAGATYYVSTNSNPQIAQANVTGNIVTVNGLESGNTVLTVCASSGSCSPLNVTVYAGAGGNIAISQNTLSLNTGQNLTITISGGTPPYTVTGGISSVAQETVNGNSLVVYGIGGGTSSVEVCSAGGGCTNLLITVSGTAAATTSTVTPVVTPVTTTVAPVSTTPPLTEYLVPGSQDAQVLQLQQELASLGYLTATPNGYFGNATASAVTKFQAANNLPQLGVVGPATRAALNTAANTASPSASTSINSMTLAQLKAYVLQLSTELGQVLGRIATLGG